MNKENNKNKAKKVIFLREKFEKEMDEVIDVSNMTLDEVRRTIAMNTKKMLQA